MTIQDKLKALKDLPPKEDARRKKKFKTAFQYGALWNAFNENPQWSQEYLEGLAKLIKLKPSEVYKWNYD